MKIYPPPTITDYSIFFEPNIITAASLYQIFFPELYSENLISVGDLNILLTLHFDK